MSEDVLATLGKVLLTMKRTEARNSAFLLLFEASFYSSLDRDELLAFASKYNEVPTDEFTLSLFHGVLDRQLELDEKISALCHGRTASRISRAVLTALRIAFYEITYTDIAPSIAISEAVILVKRYDTPEASSYANGVLAAYAGK